MNKYLFFTLIVITILGCKGRNTSTDTEQQVEISDFIEFFPPGKLPYEVSDTVFARMEKDTSSLKYEVFTQFVPDTILSAVYGKTQKPKIYPIMRTFSGDQGTYLFAKSISADKKIVYLLTFSSNNEFTGAMPLLQLDGSTATRQVSGVDRKLSIYKNVFRRAPDGSVAEGKEVFVHSPESSSFMLIMTDALDDKAGDVINPIDTFQRKNKYSGDYTQDKLNIVSIRDAPGGTFRFFIHINKNKGECTGEIKGQGKFTSSNTGTYQQPGDPCSIQFNFTASSVKLTEVEACGNRRGVKCSFDGSFTRKKEIKPRTSPKK